MYPQYWTPSIGGIFMRYSYEFKLMCVDKYRQGKWPDTPSGVKEKTFHDMVRIWAKQESKKRMDSRREICICRQGAGRRILQGDRYFSRN